MREEILRARIHFVRKGKRIASVCVDIRDSRGELVADSLVTYKIA